MHIMKIFFILFFSLTFSLHANEKVSLQLKWLHQFQFAGYYAAKEKGFYEELGLDVEIRQRDRSKNNIEQVINGDSEYGVADSILFLYKAKKEPITIVTPIFQHSPAVIMTLKSSGLDSPYKLNNKKLMFYKKDTDGFGVLSMLQHIDVTPTLKRIKDTNTYEALINKEVDAYTGYLTNEYFYFKERGIDINIIHPANYGLDLYGDMLFTNNQEAKNHPKRVEKFKEATIKGWYYALEHKEEIIKLIKEKYAASKSIEHLRYEANTLEEVIQHKLIPIGTLDKGRIQYTLQIYKKHGLIKNKVDIHDYIFKPSQSNIIVTKAEKEWIKNNPEVKFAAIKYQKPLLFLNKDNHVVGIIQDYFNILSKEIGIEISVDSRVIDKTAGHEVSKKNGNYGLATIFKHHKNEKDYLITDPYLFTNFIIFSNRKNKDKYKSLKDLEGKKVAIIRGHRMMESYFSKVKNIELVYASDAIQEMNMLQYGEVDAIVGYISYHNLIQDNLFTDISAAFTDTKRFPISMGINKEHKILHSLINKALATLSQDKKNEIISKWIKIRNIQKNEILTSKEIAYLKKKKVIKLCIDPDWMPFEKNENGKHIGMSAEYIKIIEKEIGTPIELLPTKTWSESLKLGLQRKCDVLSLVIPTKERKKYFHFTKSYLHIPLVIVTNIDEFFINDISKVVNKKIGIVKDYAFAEILKDKYPNMNIVEVANIKDGLHQVENSKLFGFIDTLATTGYHIQKNYIGQLKIAGKFDEKLELGVAVRNDEPILRNIFDKVIAQIPADKEQAILNKWVSVNYDNDVNYKPVLKWIIAIALLFISILLIILRANRKLNDEINNRKETEKKLQKLSITDELTSLYNRRYFNEIFPKLINSAKREKYNICFALLDIDFFKQYNDTYGHISGDQALQNLSACIKASMTRADDYCFRLGGEEFALIFKGHSPQEAIKFIEKVKQNIEDLKIEHKKNSASQYLTVSFGLAIKDANSIDDENELYREADILLYEAKNSGRNKICVSS